MLVVLVMIFGFVEYRGDSMKNSVGVLLAIVALGENEKVLRANDGKYKCAPGKFAVGGLILSRMLDVADN